MSVYTGYETVNLRLELETGRKPLIWLHENTKNLSVDDQLPISQSVLGTCNVYLYG